MLNFKKFVPGMVMALLGLCRSLHAQDVAPLQTVTIAAPTAAALGKYVDYPVNYHTGVPEISFPIYTVKEGPLELPVSLSYHASGLKVMEHASWVGAGFSLNVGGVITRSIHGYADERANVDKSYLADKGYYNYLYDGNGQLAYLDFMRNKRDGQPDLFMYNFNGYAGKFYFRPDGTVMSVPVSDVRITPLFCTGGVTGCNNTAEYLYGWMITTPDGVRYYFGKTTAVTNDVDAVEKTETFSLSGGISFARTFSSWYLYKVESADGKYHIDLTYQSEAYAYYSIATFAQTAGYSGGENVSGMELVKNKITGVRLSTISYSGNVISFVPEETPRQDLSRFSTVELQDYDNAEAKALKSIVINDGELCKRFNFSYSYFSSSQALPSQYGTGIEELETKYQIHTPKKRLKLDWFREMSCNGEELIPAHRFSYYQETSVPPTISLAQDHWGFYNGANGNTELLPSLSRNGGLSTTDGYGANRESSWPAMRAGTLQRITYPAGGSAEFSYRYHGIYIGATEKPVGGLRVETITTRTAPDKPAKVTSYQYINPEGVQGVLYSRPNYIALVRNTRLGESGLPTSAAPSVNDYLSFPNGCIIPGNIGLDVAIVVSPGSIHPMMTSQGYHFGYNEVKVVQADGGYTLYKYTPGSNPAGDVSVKVVNTRSCSAVSPNFPPAPEPNDFMRGLLRGVVTYNAAGQMLTEKIIDPVYTEDAFGINGLIVEPSVYELATEYELKTAKKTFERVVELTYQPGQAGADKTPFGTVRESYFDSPYHTAVTRTVTHEVAGYDEGVVIKGEMLADERSKYVGDFKTPSVQAGIPFCEDIPNGNCDQQLVTAVNQQLTSYLADVTACGANRQCRFNRWMLYTRNVNDLRKAHVNTCRTNYLAARKSCDESTQGYAAASTALRPLIDLKNRNQRQSLVELSQWRNNKFLGSFYITYTVFDANRKFILPSKRLMMDVAVPLPSFTPAANSGTTISKNSNYRDQETYNYTSGKLTETWGVSEGSTAYLWGYGDRYPIMKATHAASTQVYYNGFEFSGPAGEGALGTGYLNSGTFTIPFTPPADGNLYKMSYWYWDGSWKFSGEQPFAAIINQGSRLDEVRVYPSGSAIASFTYALGKGISSSADANGIRTYYKYDDLGRLVTIKDHNGDIVKQYHYRYYVKQQVD